MRRAAKVDSNQSEIVDALRKVGCSVAITSTVGEGFPDLVVGKANKNYLIEIKDSKKPPSKRKLTEAQVDFHALWRGQVSVVETVEQAINLVKEKEHG